VKEDQVKFENPARGGRSQLAATGVVLAAVAAFGLSACSGSSHNSSPAPNPTAAASSSAPASGPAGPSSTSAPAPSGAKTAATTEPATGPATIPDLAGVVVTAKMTSTQVSELHDIAISAGHPGSIPANVIPSTAAALVTKLRAQITACTALKPAASSPPGLLASSLDSYAGLATQVSKWNATSNQPLTAAFFTQLKAADAHWKAAVQAVGAAAHQDLLSGVPPLLFPKS
jgi:hypothetical protein